MRFVVSAMLLAPLAENAFAAPLLNTDLNLFNDPNSLFDDFEASSEAFRNLEDKASYSITNGLPMASPNGVSHCQPPVSPASNDHDKRQIDGLLQSPKNVVGELSLGEISMLTTTLVIRQKHR